MTLTGLLADTEYVFTAVAVNSAGTSEPSEASAPAATLPVVPPGPPRDVVVEACSGTAGGVSLSWLPPAREGGAPVGAYHVSAVSAGQTVTVVVPRLAMPDALLGTCVCAAPHLHGVSTMRSTLFAHVMWLL